MKQPFWILNSILLAILTCLLLFIFYSKVKIPQRQKIDAYEIPIEKAEGEINLDVIFKNDLFNTYEPEIKIPEIPIEERIPSPPTPVSPKVPEIFAPQFLDPVDITLTGIIIQEDETQNTAIILDNKTKNQINYYVGDEIEDAQLIRILRNKIILIRSNGQQEVIYLREEDVNEDSPVARATEFKDVVKQISEYQYIIDPFKFVSYIRNLGEFLDAFDLSTAYKEGTSIGSKIVKLNPDSIAIQMGLLPGDIITKIDEIDATDNENRFEIYNKILTNKEDDIIKVDILRRNDVLTYNYKLKKIERTKPRQTEEKTQLIQLEENRIEDEKIKIMKEKYQFAPTIDQIALREKQNLFKRKK